LSGKKYKIRDIDTRNIKKLLDENFQEFISDFQWIKTAEYANNLILYFDGNETIRQDSERKIKKMENFLSEFFYGKIFSLILM